MNQPQFIKLSFFTEEKPTRLTRYVNPATIRHLEHGFDADNKTFMVLHFDEKHEIRLIGEEIEPIREWLQTHVSNA